MNTIHLSYTRLAITAAVVLMGGGYLFASPLTRAVGEAPASPTNITDGISVTVDSSCMLSANVVADHTVTIYPGEVQSSIGTTNIKAFCNDADGYSLYVKAANTTSLTSTTSDYTIPTGLNVNGTTSSWSMKLTPSGTSYIPELGNYFQNTTTDANGYSIVPADYEEATHYSAPTDLTVGS